MRTSSKYKTTEESQSFHLKRSPVESKNSFASQQNKFNTGSFNFSQVPLQAKLKINAPGDRYEQEADRIADKAINMNPSTSILEQGVAQLQGKPLAEEITGINDASAQRKCAKCEEEEEMLQRKATNSGSVSAPQTLASQLSGTKNSGSAMDGNTKQFMSSRFGVDFGNVKIHNHSNANAMSQSINAKAFTLGNDIYFNKGEYNPQSQTGKNLLAHELVHTLQQGGETGNVQRYSHEDCDTNSDLKPHIWPADGIAKTMVNKAITALSASTVSAATNGILDNHFNDHSASTVSKVLEVFKSIKAAFDENDYTYECEDDCDDENAYVYGAFSDIHVCMNFLRGKANKGIAAIIVHEFSHYYGGTDDNLYFFSFGNGSAPSSLSVSDAVENADSFEGFAYDI